jgi:Fe-S-cluster containining protein
VYLSESDLTKLCHWSLLEREAFINTYCRWVPYFDETEILALKEKPGYDCILWDNGCVAYDVRPVQCMTYPFWDSLLAARDSWDAEALECPGINQGELRSFAEIEQNLFSYKGNSPVRRNRECR